MKIANLYFDVSMSRGHKGLREIQRTQLDEGECAIFVNRAWTALKMLTPANIILHLKQPTHRPIDPDAIKFLPNCVNGTTLNYPAALKASLEHKYRKRYPAKKGG